MGVHTHEELLRDIITMKQNNINAIRTSHYPVSYTHLHKADHAVLHTHGSGDVLCAGEHIGLLDLVVDDGGGVIGHLAAVRAVGCLLYTSGDQIANLEAAGEVDRFIFGFEESYGYLAGPCLLYTSRCV